jgi:hypothetical protein
MYGVMRAESVHGSITRPKVSSGAVRMFLGTKLVAAGVARGIARFALDRNPQ